MGRNNQRALTNQSFNPAAIGSIYLWLDGTDSSTITLTSNAVSEWRDKSDNARHVTQATASQRPVMGFLNGRPAVQFTAANSQTLSRAGSFLDGNPAFTTFVVFQKLSSLNVTPFGWGSQNTGGLFLLFPSQVGGSASSYSFGGATTYPFVLNNADPDSFHPLNKTWFDCFVKPAGPVTNARAFRSGQFFPSAGASTATPNISGPLVIGQTPGVPAQVFDGLIGEILIYNKALTDTERQEVEQYISKKWRITLANYKLATSVAAPAVSSPLDISNCALWLDGSDTSTLYTTDAGPVTAVTAPTDISGCVGWWDASDATTLFAANTGTTPATTTVGRWANKGTLGATADLLQATAASRPTTGAATRNGRNVIRFDGTDDWMQRSFTLGFPTTAFIVFSFNNPFTATQTLLDGVGTGNTLRLATTAQTAFLACTGGVLPQFTLNGWGDIQPWQVASLLVNGASSLARRDGTVTANGSGTLGTVTAPSGITLASWGASGSQYADVSIAEVIVFNSALPAADRARVEKYLAIKWAINRVHDTPGAGDFVGYWGDKSGNSRHFTTTTTTRPALAATGRAGVVFNASPLYNTAANLTVTAQTTVVVTSLDNTVTNTRIFSQVPSSGADFSVGGHYIPLLRTSSSLAISSWVDGTNRASVSVANAVGAVMASVHTGTSIVNYVNGVRSSAYTPTAALNLAVATMSLMGDQSGAATTTGRVSAVLVYNRALSAAEIASLTSHLSATYGIGVLAPVSGHPEVQDWINRVYRNGGSVSQYTADQVTSFAREIDSAGLRSLLYRVNLFCGNDINAAFVPLYRGPVALDTRFGNEIDVTTGSGVAFTYSEGTGLQGDPVSNGGGARRYLNTGVILGAVPQLVGNHHISAYTNRLPSIGDATVGTPIGVYESASRGMTLYITQEVYNVGAFANSLLNFANSTAPKALPTDRGHYIANHISPILNIYEAGTKIGERNLTGFLITTPTVFPVCVFAEGRPSPSVPLFNYTNPMQGYSIGAGLTAAQALAFSQIMELFQQRLSRGRLVVSA